MESRDIYREKGDKDTQKELKRRIFERAYALDQTAQGIVATKDTSTEKPWGTKLSKEDEERRRGEKEAAEKQLPPEGITINGIIMEMYWDTRYNQYAIHFPQIKIGAREKGKREYQYKIISSDPKIARERFEDAKRIAQQSGDVYKIYDSIPHGPL